MFDCPFYETFPHRKTKTKMQCFAPDSLPGARHKAKKWAPTILSVSADCSKEIKERYTYIHVHKMQMFFDKKYKISNNCPSHLCKSKWAAAQITSLKRFRFFYYLSSPSISLSSAPSFRHLHTFTATLRHTSPQKVPWQSYLTALSRSGSNTQEDRCHLTQPLLTPALMQQLTAQVPTSSHAAAHSASARQLMQAHANDQRLAWKKQVLADAWTAAYAKKSMTSVTSVPTPSSPPPSPCPISTSIPIPLTPAPTLWGGTLLPKPPPKPPAQWEFWLTKPDGWSCTTAGGVVTFKEWGWLWCWE